jgi:threonine/homoserine/homoserine lactone efflux protein
VADWGFSPGLFLRSVLIGISIAAPLGPIGVLCVRRTLAQGVAFGLATGVGAASADALYAALAGSGLAFVSAFLVGKQLWIHLAGGLFLCYLGIRTTLSVPANDAPEVSRKGLAGAYATTFILTLTNPVTMISFAGIFAGLGFFAVGNRLASVSSMVLGVFIGSCLWWLFLSLAISLFRHRVGTREMLWVNRISGGIIIAFGIFVIADIIFL